MAKKLAWGRAWHGRSRDPGRMTLSELRLADANCPAIGIYVALAIVTVGVPVVTLCGRPLPVFAPIQTSDLRPAS